MTRRAGCLSDVTTEMWRAAGTPRGAHALSEALSTPTRYAHCRGVAQQATRAANRTHIGRDERRLLLAAAWLHDIGYALGGDFHPVVGARAMRLAGHERLARIIAHHSGAALHAQAAGLPSLHAEFPAPVGLDARLRDLLDVADLVTSPTGECVSPAGRLRGLADRHGLGHAAIRALVANTERLSRSADLRTLVEQLGPDARAESGVHG